MTEGSTYKNELYEFYELYHDTQTSATSPTLTVSGKKPHADVIASSGHKLKRTRVYVNGKRATITEVALNVNDTDISVSDTIVSGDTVDIFLAATTGTLENNTATGKFPLVELQVAQGYSVTSNTFDQPGCGTGRKETLLFEPDSRIMLGLNRRGNDNLKNFISARKNKKYLMIIVKDSTDPVTTYNVLHEVRVETYERATKALDTKEGVVVDVISLRFVPDVDVTFASQHATSYDDATLSGLPTIIKLQSMDLTHYYVKAYPTASATANEVSDPVGTDVMGIDDATLSGLPRVFEIISGDTSYYFTAYPTISAEVVASSGLIPAPASFAATPISGTPRILAIPISGTDQYLKAYPKMG